VVEGRCRGTRMAFQPAQGKDKTQESCLKHLRLGFDGFQ
jgi:hypothetical protein